MRELTRKGKGGGVRPSETKSKNNDVAGQRDLGQQGNPTRTGGHAAGRTGRGARDGARLKNGGAYEKRDLGGILGCGEGTGHNTS